MRSPTTELLVFVVLTGTGIGAQAVLPASWQDSPAQAQAETEKKTTKSRKICSLPAISAHRLQDIVDASSALPPSLGADAMIRISAKVASACPDFATDLLLRAFDQAESVEPETSYMLGIATGPTDSRVNYAAHGYELEMDRLSLRSRVVLGLAALDPTKAIQLFQSMTPPHPPASTCTDAFLPDVSIYYQALGQVVHLMKSKKTRTDAEAQAPFLQLQEISGATVSPVQMSPLSKILEDADLSATELSALLGTLAGSIENFPIDGNFFSSRGSYPAVDAKVKLVQLAGTRQVSPNALTHSFHDYLDRSLNGPHCAGNVPKDLKELVLLYESFNRRPAVSDQGVEPLTVPTSAPPIEPEPDQGKYWLSPKAKELLVDAKHLNYDDNWRHYTDADRQTPKWQDRVSHLVDDMDDWHATDEASPADYYHQRCMLLYETLAYLPSGTLYDRVVATWISTFAESSLQWDNSAEWYFEVSRFLDFSRKDHKGQTPQAALAALNNSSNPYLHSVGLVAEFLGTKSRK
jgi:hypothetical protein